MAISCPLSMTWKLTDWAATSGKPRPVRLYLLNATVSLQCDINGVILLYAVPTTSKGLDGKGKLLSRAETIRNNRMLFSGKEEF